MQDKMKSYSNVFKLLVESLIEQDKTSEYYLIDKFTTQYKVYLFRSVIARKKLRKYKRIGRKVQKEVWS